MPKMMYKRCGLYFFTPTKTKTSEKCGSCKKSIDPGQYLMRLQRGATVRSDSEPTMLCNSCIKRLCDYLTKYLSDI